MPHKLLWAHPVSLHDTSSGASINIISMLEALFDRNIQVKALCSPIFFSPFARSLFIKRLGSPFIPANPFTLSGDKLDITYIPCASSNYNLQTREEMTRFFSAFHAILNNFRPDILMTFADDCLAMALQAEANLRDLPIVCPVLNSNYFNNNFKFANCIFTESKETANQYQKIGINVKDVGPFINSEKILIKKHRPQYITFVNPIHEKGVALAARLALMAEKKYPDLKFLFVESRGNTKNIFESLYNADDSNDYPLKIRQLQNLEIVQHTNDMREIYSKTSLLLVPSLCYESFGLVVTEAMMNGIPVLASQSGGLVENVGDGGQCLEVPYLTKNDWKRIPTEDEVQPWFNALYNMLNKNNYAKWQKKAYESSKRYNISKSIDKILELLKPLFEKKAGSKSDFINKSAFK